MQKGCATVEKSYNKRLLPYQTAVERLQEASNGRYIFKLDTYIGKSQKVECKCNKCGCEWDARFYNLTHHSIRTGCPNQCYKQHSYVSKPEHEIVDFIKQNFPQLEVQQSVKSILKNPQGTHAMELDIYIPELKLAFEFNGTYWHSDEIIVRNKSQFASAQQYHDYKTEQCKQKGIELNHINEQDYKIRPNCVFNNVKDIICRYL